MDSQSDIEELEERLYSQIYHLEAENLQVANVFDIPECSQVPSEQNWNKTGRQRFRYHRSEEIELNWNEIGRQSFRYNRPEETWNDVSPNSNPKPAHVDCDSNRKKRRFVKLTTAFDDLFKTEIRKKARTQRRKERKGQIAIHTRFGSDISAINNNEKEVEVIQLEEKDGDDVITISDDEDVLTVDTNDENLRSVNVGQVESNHTKVCSRENSDCKLGDATVAVEVKISKSTDISKDSDEEVIFVEAPKVVITIDHEDNLLRLNETPTNLASTSQNTSNIFEEAELMSIPESNSDNFLETSASCLNLLSGDLAVPAPSCRKNSIRINDTESVSSFNSTEVDVPIVNFSFKNTSSKELNLDDFANYIKSKGCVDASKSDLVSRKKPKTPPVFQGKSQVLNESDSSSESDYDECNVAENNDNRNDDSVVIIEEQAKKVCAKETPNEGKQVSDETVKLEVNKNMENSKVVENDDSDDEVIFVETEKVVIMIDDEESLTPKKNRTSVANQSQNKHNTSEENDLLSIPESNSNDFLEIPASSRLNFMPVELATPPPRKKRVCINDTESVSSFNSSTEVDAPIGNFSFTTFKSTPCRELNLDDFANYIRSEGRVDASKSDLVTVKKPKTAPAVQAKRKLLDESDTSSESDYDDSITTEKTLFVADDSVIIIDNNETFEDDDNKQKNAVLEDEEERTPSKECKPENANPNFDDSNNVIHFVEDDDSDDEMYENNEIDTSELELVNVDFPKEASKSDDKPANVQRRNFSDYWTDDMSKFYRDSWGHENYSVDHQKKLMSDNPRHWRIISTDRPGNSSPRGRRCHRCREVGHKFIDCQLRYEAPKCILCGKVGHTAYMCPNQICPSCGRRTSRFPELCKSCHRNQWKRMHCNICSYRNHKTANCPDLWRRYLFTTNEGDVQIPSNNVIKPAEDRWCCYCGERGHFEFNCKFNSAHSITSTLIYDYGNVYKHKPVEKVVNPAAVVEEISKNLSLQETGETQDVFDDNVMTLNQSNYEYLKLSPKDTKVLLSVKGAEFLKKINNDTKLKFKLISEVKGNNTQYYCIICGTTDAIPSIQDTIKNFCQLSDLIPEKLAVIQNLKPSWCSSSIVLYKKIKMEELKLPFMRTKTLASKMRRQISQRYCTLNSILMAKLKMADGAKHIRFLKNWLKNFNCQWQYIEDAKTSYDYVFNNSSRFDVHYQRLTTLRGKAVNSPRSS